MWRCSASKRIYVPTRIFCKPLFKRYFRASGLPVGSPDESDRFRTKRQENGLSPRFWAYRVTSRTAQAGRREAPKALCGYGITTRPAGAFQRAVRTERAFRKTLSSGACAPGNETVSVSSRRGTALRVEFDPCLPATPCTQGEHPHALACSRRQGDLQRPRKPPGDADSLVRPGYRRGRRHDARRRTASPATSSGTCRDTTRGRIARRGSRSSCCRPRDAVDQPIGACW